jgi:hypothetical protein
MTGTVTTVVRVFNGSDGKATQELYARLQRLGPAGVVAMNLLRAQKNSGRAKVYRGGNRNGSYKQQAYQRKQWAMGQLCVELLAHGAEAGVTRWGWQIDTTAQGPHAWVLYVELLNRGQVSFHTDERGNGPDYTVGFDGAVGASVNRILYFAADVLDRLEPLCEASA